MKRVTVGLAGLLLLAAIGFGAWRMLRPQYDLVRHDKASDADRAWPLKQFWTWTARVPAVADEQLVELRVYAKSMPLSAEGRGIGYPMVGGQPLMTESDADVTARCGGRFKRADLRARPLEITIQVIDWPASVPAATQPAGRLELLGTLHSGGVANDLTGTESLPLQGRVAGWGTESEKNWDGDTLQLARLWTKDATQLHQFDVVLVRRDASDE